MFSRSLILTLLSAPFLVLADSPNPFKVPTSGLSATAGQPLQLSWTPTTQGTVSLILRSGSSNDLAAGTEIASSISNSGSYTWTPASTITRGSDYTVEIVDDSDPSQTNFTPYFVLDSDTTVAYSTSQVTLGMTSATSALSTASPTGSATTVSITSVSASTGSASSASGSMTGSSASGSSASAATTSGSASSQSGSASQASTIATATTSGAGFQSSSASASQSAQSQSNAAAPRATAMAGMLGLAALGALAL